MGVDLLTFVLSQLDLREPAWTEVAQGSGVPYSTLKKIATRVTPNPGVLHVQRLARYFTERAATTDVPAASAGAAAKEGATPVLAGEGANA